jgi:hypothetical protein
MGHDVAQHGWIGLRQHLCRRLRCGLRVMQQASQ